MIIDFRVRPPIKGYLRASMYTNPDLRNRYTRSLGLEPAPSAEQRSMPLLLEEMDAAGVTRAVVTARVSDFFGSVTNAEVAAIVSEYPGRFIGVAAVDPTNRRNAIRQIDDAIAMGLKAVNIEPGAYPVPMYADDARLYPLYAHCEDHRIPVIIMNGGNAGPDLSYSFTVPLDRVAADFPDLKIVVSHGGWPWVTQVIHVAYRRPNVYLSPDMYLHEVPGMDHYLQALRGFLAERFLFASCYPLTPVKDYTDWFQKLPLSPHVRERALWRNAADLLRL